MEKIKPGLHIMNMKSPSPPTEYSLNKLIEEQKQELQKIMLRRTIGRKIEIQIIPKKKGLASSDQGEGGSIKTIKELRSVKKAISRLKLSFEE